jgi:class 3 adenylate cyclase/tetratricopeptide (TPR) repeat protein
LPPKRLGKPTHITRKPLEDERKQVTVLFADLRGSMELLANRDPEEARAVLDPVVERMTEAVRRYEGTVSQVMGDGIMALFGAPIAYEDHAVRACYAALRMQDAIRRYSDDVRRARGFEIQIRVGLNSGEAVVGSFDTDLSTGYAAIGQTVHLAARMEQMARPGSILATQDTMLLVQSHIRTRPLGRMPIRGLVTPVDVYEILGTTEAHPPIGAGEVRGLSPFTGRDAELAHLWGALDRARQDRGHAVTVSGEPGIGKSRLLYEFTRSSQAQGCLILESGAAPCGNLRPHQPGLNLLRQHFQIQSDDDIPAIRQKVRAKVLAMDKSLGAAIPPLLALLNALPEGDAFAELEAPDRRQRTLDAGRAVLARECTVQPVVVVVEDAQWADSDSLGFLDSLVEDPLPGMLLIVSYRPNREDRWHGKPNCTPLRLEPLPFHRAGELLDALIGVDPSVRGLKSVLIERTDGNPLFLEESVRSLVETGVLRGERSAYCLTTPVAALDVPPTLKALIAARIDRLPPEQKWLLQAASVIGKHGPVAVLQAVVGADGHSFREVLEALRGNGFLADGGGGTGEEQFRFNHSLTHLVAYDALLQERRRLLHAQTLEAMEQLYAGRLTHHAETLAHHARHGEVWDKAVLYLRQAGRRTLERSATYPAAQYFEQALEALHRLPATAATMADAADLHLELRNAMVPLGDYPRMFEHLQEAKQLAEKLQDERRLARALSSLSNHFSNTGDSEASLRTGQEALAIAERVGEFDLQVIGNLTMGASWRALGDYPRAVHLLRKDIALLQGEHTYRHFGLVGVASVVTRSHLVWSLAELGEFVEALHWAEEEVQIAEAAEHTYSLVHALLGLGGVLLRRSNFDRLAPVLERAAELSEHVPLLFPPVAADLAVAHARSGDVQRGLALARQAVDRGSAMGRIGRLALIIVHLGEVSLLAGDRQEAAEQARRALDLSRQQQERGNEVYALELLAASAAHADPPDLETGETHARAAMRLAEALGMRPLLARCRLDLGMLYRRSGRTSGAREHLAAALRMFNEMDMPYWRRKAEGEVEALG